MAAGVWGSLVCFLSGQSARCKQCGQGNFGTEGISTIRAILRACNRRMTIGNEQLSSPGSLESSLGFLSFPIRTRNGYRCFEQSVSLLSWSRLLCSLWFDRSLSITKFTSCRPADPSADSTQFFCLGPDFLSLLPGARLGLFNSNTLYAR